MADVLRSSTHATASAFDFETACRPTSHTDQLQLRSCTLASSVRATPMQQRYQSHDVRQCDDPCSRTPSSAPQLALGTNVHLSASNGTCCERMPVQIFAVRPPVSLPSATSNLHPINAKCASPLAESASPTQLPHCTLQFDIRRTPAVTKT